MKFLNLYNLILEELTDKQKKLTDKYAAERSDYLSFGPIFKEERTYFPLKSIKTSNIEVPEEIRKTLDNAGFYITDYRTGIAMKKAKPGEQKDLRKIKIGKILDKLNKHELLKQFNERLGTSKKDIQNIQFEICVTHNPYDIAGMSTDRNWTSCMDLNDGLYKDTPLLQVMYGGMVAYLISSEDKNIEKPFARIAIKRFILSYRDQTKFVFAAENRIYGDVDLANELNFQKKLVEILNKSNKLTADSYGLYIRSDGNSYSDTYEKKYYWIDEDNLNNLDNITKKQFENLILYKNVSCNTVKYFIKKYPDLLSQETLWHMLKCYDIDKELIEIFLQHNLCLQTFRYAKNLTANDVINILNKYNFLQGDDIVDYFLTNKNIKFTNEDLDYILQYFWHKFNKWTLYVIFSRYVFNKKILNKYLEKILNEYPSIIDIEQFLWSQDFPIDILIKYCDFNTLSGIYMYNNHLSKENKEKLKQYLDEHEND